MSTLEKTIGLGLSGCGMGSLLLRINHDPESRIKLRGLYDPDSERLHQRYDAGKSLAQEAEEYNVDIITDNYNDLLKDKNIHIIGIFSPCVNHFEQIKAAIEHGKHVIVTKPMVISMDQAREVVELVEKAGVKFLVAQSMRWNDMFLKIRELYDSGDIGDIRLAESYYVHDLRTVNDKSPWRYKTPQDYIYGGVCHPADLLRWYLGEVDEVFAYGHHGGFDKRYPADKETNFIISLKYRSGIIARIIGAFDLVHPPALWRRANFHGVGIGLYGTKASLFNDRIVYDYYGTGKGPVEKDIMLDKEPGHAEEMLGCLRHFEQCLEGNEKPLVGVRDGAQIVAICSACWESIKSGLPVKVSREFDI